MKKVLFGICALAISASAFGAIMSNGTITDAATPVSVALPIKLEANVVNGANKLFIEGTSGDVFGDVLSLNFGDLAHNQVGKTEGRVRVFRGDSWKTDKFEPTPLGADVTFSFIINGVDTGADAGKNLNTYYQFDMTRTEIANNTGNVAGEKLKVGIAMTSVSFDAENMTNSTEVEARVAAMTEPIKNTQAEGRYYGSASIVAELQGGAPAVKP